MFSCRTLAARHARKPSYSRYLTLLYGVAGDQYYTLRVVAKCVISVRRLRSFWRAAHRKSRAMLSRRH